MREYKDLTREYLTPKLKPWRKKHKDTQETMSEKLRMSSRAYAQLERGKCGFSCTTLLLFFSLLTNEEIIVLVREFTLIILQLEEEKPT